MRLNIKRSTIAVAFLIFFKPLLWMKVLCLDRHQVEGNLMTVETPYLLHVPKHLFSTPSWDIPIIVILFDPTNAHCSVNPTRPSKAFATSGVDSTPIQSRVGLCDNIPVVFAAKHLGPKWALLIFLLDECQICTILLPYGCSLRGNCVFQLQLPRPRY
jgi:hypothetical protein